MRSVSSNFFCLEKFYRTAILKFLSIQAYLKNSGYNIENVTRHNYQDVYTFSHNGDRITTPISLYYDREGIFKCVTLPHGPNNEALQQCVNSTLQLPESISYSPSCETLKMLYQLMRSACNESGVTITNIDEQLQQYYVTYNLITDARFACIQFYITNDKLTKALPKSEQGKNDKKLSQLVKLIKETYTV